MYASIIKPALFEVARGLEKAVPHIICNLRDRVEKLKVIAGRVEGA